MNAIASSTRARTPRTRAWSATFSGFCATLVGIGLARFAYTPLLPAIVEARWFDASQAAYLGAANLAGYLAGALLGRALTRRVSEAAALRGMMLLATAAFFACAHPLGLAWFSAWKVLAGVAGGALMVLAAPAVLPCVAPRRRGLASGVMFMGVGLGVAASATLVPLLLRHGLAPTWNGLGALSALLSAAAWPGWPRQDEPPSSARGDAPAHPPRPVRTAAVRALYLQYALGAVGLVPHMVFLVAFVASGLGRGLDAGSGYWALFGLGAMLGPLLAGALGDHFGSARTLRLAFLLEAGAVALPALLADSLALAASSLLVGGFVTGIVSLTLGRIHDMLAHHPSRQGPAWRSATVAFATFQALGAYAMSWVFSRSSGDFRLLFLLGAGALVAALAVDLAAGGAAAAPLTSRSDARGHARP